MSMRERAPGKSGRRSRSCVAAVGGGAGSAETLSILVAPRASARLRMWLMRALTASDTGAGPGFPRSIQRNQMRPTRSSRLASNCSAVMTPADGVLGACAIASPAQLAVAIPRGANVSEGRSLPNAHKRPCGVSYGSSDERSTHRTEIPRTSLSGLRSSCVMYATASAKRGVPPCAACQ
jgi:hypothetical protein